MKVFVSNIKVYWHYNKLVTKTKSRKVENLEPIFFLSYGFYNWKIWVSCFNKFCQCIKPFRSMSLLQVSFTDMSAIKMKYRNIQNLESGFPITLSQNIKSKFQKHKEIINILLSLYFWLIITIKNTLKILFI